MIKSTTKSLTHQPIIFLVLARVKVVYIIVFMKVAYDPAEIEPYWQKVWEENNLYQTPEPSAASAKASASRGKMYILDMFPYPSGAGLHVGHIEGYTGTDVLSRYLRMKGFSVLHPIGWDAFGLPAENYAIKNGIAPFESTHNNIKNFKRQINQAGLSYNWKKEIDTSSAEYYKWTQWLFILLYKHGLVYKKKAPANWCPSCETVLANEQVVDGKCERCGTEVTQKDLKQWFFKITDYADRLIEGLDHVDWPKSTKLMQINWIGRKEGVLIKFEILNPKSEIKEIEVFTTRADTIFGATFVALAPEHEFTKQLAITNEEIADFIRQISKETQIQRERLAKDKKGIDTGLVAIDPLSGKEIPIWVADYVLGTTGTGAIMGVPAHDQRDFEFAKKYHLPIIRVIHKENTPIRSILMSGKEITDVEIERLGISIVEKKNDEHVTRYLEIPEDNLNRYKDLVRTKLTPGYWNETVGEEIWFCFKDKDDQVEEYILDNENNNQIALLMAQFNNEETSKDNTWSQLASTDFYSDLIKHSDYGVLENSGQYSALSSKEASIRLVEDLDKRRIGQKKTTYHLRDWLVSRQRYWGAPIPMIKCDTCGWQPVPITDLPVLLPEDVDFTPKGESPIAKSKTFQKGATCPKCSKPARREVDTMDTFVDSSWYFLRFCDPKNTREPWDRKRIDPWVPVDVYVGGAEHSVLHLMYARFFYKFFYDLGMVPKEKGDEPFLKLRHPGTVLGPDSRKMSKRWDNVINPDDVIKQYGADTLRMYEMFMGPFEAMKPWSVESVAGVNRFLARVYVWYRDFNHKVVARERINKNLEIEVNKLVKKVTEDIESFSFNTSIAAMMGFLNEMTLRADDQTGTMTWKEMWEKFLLVLAPFAPHLAEELWQELQLSHSGNPPAGGASRISQSMTFRDPGLGQDDAFVSVHQQSWPVFDKKILERSNVTIAVTVNSKLRGTVEIKVGKSQKEVEEIVKKSPIGQKHLLGKNIKKFIYVAGRIVNVITD